MSFTLIGLEALEKALCCWEDALTAFSSTLFNDTVALPSRADAAFTHDVQELLDMGYQIQSHAELLFLDQVQRTTLRRHFGRCENREIAFDDSESRRPSFARNGSSLDAIPFRLHSSSIAFLAGKKYGN